MPSSPTELQAVLDGGTTRFTATGFAPGSEVDLVLCSTPTLLGTFRADAQGRVDQAVVIPAGTVAGRHELIALGQRSNGLTMAAHASVDVQVRVLGPLPVTGSGAGSAPAMGAALIVLGLAAVVGSIRVRRTRLCEAD